MVRYIPIINSKYVSDSDECVVWTAYIEKFVRHKKIVVVESKNKKEKHAAINNIVAVDSAMFYIVGDEYSIKIRHYDIYKTICRYRLLEDGEKFAIIPVKMKDGLYQLYVDEFGYEISKVGDET